MSQENSNFNTSAKPDVSRPILIFRLGSLGDTILAMPCFHLIRRVYPDRKIFLLASEPISGKAAAAMTVLDGSGLCDEVIAYPTKVRNFRRLFALRQQIKSHRFEMVFHLFTNRGWLRNWRDYLFFRACGIKCIIGTPPPFRRNSITTSHPLVEQQCIGLVRRLRQIGDIDVSDKAAWNLRLNAEEKETAEILLQGSKVSHPFIAASIGTKSPINDWGDDNWKQLFELLSTAHPELGLILIGSPDEFKRSEHIRRYWRGTSANFCGKCLPRVSAGILERAALFVGHDSGPMHLAAAAGIPVVGLFSWCNPPEEWFPGCAQWDHLKIFYPPLPGGVWKAHLRTRRSPSEGILLTKPGPVAETCFDLLKKFASDIRS